MKRLVTGVVAAMAMGVMAESANTVEVTKFHQSYPYSGKATVEYTVGGALPANAFAENTLTTDDFWWGDTVGYARERGGCAPCGSCPN